MAWNICAFQGLSLAISNFLRQHDLVQVQWVFLSLVFFNEAPQRDGPSISQRENETQVGTAPNDRAVAKSAPICFERLLVIVGGGELDPTELGELHRRGAGVVAADGGARWCAKAGLVPDAIIGDMDSLEDRAGWGKKTRLLEISEQESTDFEKCLYSTRAPVTLAMGVTGKRLDHTLGALDCAARYGTERHIVIAGETDLVVVATGKFCFTFLPGARVSVHPVTPIAFKGSRGLDYSLEGIALAPGVRSGTSNRTAKGKVEIEPDRAGQNTPYLVIMAKEYLDAVISQLAGERTC